MVCLATKKLWGPRMMPPQIVHAYRLPEDLVWI